MRESTKHLKTQLNTKLIEIEKTLNMDGKNTLVPALSYINQYKKFKKLAESGNITAMEFTLIDMNKIIADNPQIDIDLINKFDRLRNSSFSKVKTPEYRLSPPSGTRTTKVR